MSTSPYTTNATIPIGGSYNALLYILGNILPDNTQELIPILTNTQFMAFSVPSDSVGFKIYNTTQALMYAWTGSSWSVVNDATAANLVANTILGQTIINISSTNPPSANQVLVATSPTTATWQNQSGSGGGGPYNPSYTTIIGDGTSTVLVVTHNLATELIIFGAWEIATGEAVDCKVAILNSNQVSLEFTTAPATASISVIVVSAITAPGSGTVTSVSGTGTVDGLTLSGLVTSSGSLTLSGAITGFEPSLGNPSVSGYVLSSTTGGIRSWVAGGSGGSSSWGSITGTLSSQTDLQSALNSKQASLSGTGFVKISGSTISYDNSTYYLASNPNGYTNNTGTVTSVSGTGTVSGLTLSGSITTTGSLTLSGTITGFEPSLGNPSVNGYVLSSTTSGVRSWVAQSGGGVVWGAITGTLSSQTDLQTALNALQPQLNGTGFVKASGTSISYDNSTYYLASNPSGYTNNTGTVTSVSGTGTVSGLTLSGSITGSGSLTLSGAITGFEPSLGNPSVSGYVLSSTTGGVRSWVANSGGGGFSNPMTTAGDIIFENATPAPDRLPIGTSGQILTVSSGLPAWVTPVNGSTSVYNYYDPDMPPTSSSAQDDEFNVTGLNSKWTQVNWGSLTAYDINTTSINSLYVKAPTLSNTLSAILQAIPAGDFSIVTKATVSNIAAASGGPALLLSTTNTTGTGSQVIHQTGVTNSNLSIYAQTYTWTNFNSVGSALNAAHDTFEINYLRIRRSGTTYYWGVSSDGKTWSESSTTALGFTPLYFGLAIYLATGPIDLSFDYFRYYPSATNNFGGTRYIGSSIGNTFNYYDSDMPFTNPSTYDDEFNVVGLNGKWSGISLGSLISYDVNTSAPDCLYMKSSATNYCCTMQALPAGDFTIWTKIATANDNAGSGHSNTVLLVSDGITAGSGNQHAVIASNSAGTRNTASIYAMTNFTTLGAGQDNYTTPIRYLKLRRTGSTYYWGWSEDGKTWMESQVNPGFTPAYMGIGLAVPSGPAVTSFEYFRYQASATAILGGTRIVGTSVTGLPWLPNTLTPPNPVSFTANNLASNTATGTLQIGQTTLYCANTTINSNSFYYTSYTNPKRCIVLAGQSSMVVQSLFSGCYVGDGSGKWISFMVGNYSGLSPAPFLYVTQWTSVTVASTSPFAGGGIGCSISEVFLSIYDDGTNLYFQYSIDGGQNWDTAYQQARGSFLTAGPNQFGWGLFPATSSNTMRVNFRHWAVQ